MRNEQGLRSDQGVAVTEADRQERLEALRLAIRASHSIRCENVGELLVAADAILRWLHRDGREER